MKKLKQFGNLASRDVISCKQQDGHMLSTRLNVLYLFVCCLLFFSAKPAFSQSDFSSTGDFTLTGTGLFQNYTLNDGHTLTLRDGEVDTIRACGTITINGIIDGNGKGFTAGVLSSIGNGTGGGGTSVTGGSGGGGYGGAGGTGGFDLGDIPGAGGGAYGNAATEAILLGSGGGSSNNALGGNGGGAIILIAPTIIINGNINLNGIDGLSNSRSGGGGAAGGILIVGDNVTITSIISANGGAGGPGTSSANDSGGGGGGGRIKIFFGMTLNNTGALSVTGGVGGPNGNGGPGQDGQMGSTNAPMVMFDPIAACPTISTPAVPQSTIPTMSQWGVFLFGLLVLNLSLVFVYRKKSVLAGTEHSTFSNTPFNKASFLRYFGLGLLTLFAVFTIAIVIFGYELMPFDVPGSVLSAGLVGYLIQLVKE